MRRTGKPATPGACHPERSEGPAVHSCWHSGGRTAGPSLRSGRQKQLLRDGEPKNRDRMKTRAGLEHRRRKIRAVGRVGEVLRFEREAAAARVRVPALAVN